MVYINMKIHLHHECKSLYNVERIKTKQKTKNKNTALIYQKMQQEQNASREWCTLNI